MSETEKCMHIWNVWNTLGIWSWTMYTYWRLTKWSVHLPRIWETENYTYVWDVSSWKLRIIPMSGMSQVGNWELYLCLGCLKLETENYTYVWDVWSWKVRIIPMSGMSIVGKWELYLCLGCLVGKWELYLCLGCLVGKWELYLCLGCLVGKWVYIWDCLTLESIHIFGSESC